MTEYEVNEGMQLLEEIRKTKRLVDGIAATLDSWERARQINEERGVKGIRKRARMLFKNAWKRHPMSEKEAQEEIRPYLYIFTDGLNGKEVEMDEELLIELFVHFVKKKENLQKKLNRLGTCEGAETDES